MPAKQQPVALTIAGMDSSGGAGVAVDLATFAALGVGGRSVVTAVTAQSDKAVFGVQGTRPAMITAQLEAAFQGRKPKAAKCGMLFSGGVVEAVADFWAARRVPLVVDPVLASSSGTALLNASGVRAMKRRLLPLATLVTPNVSEAEALSGITIREPEHMRHAARTIFEQFGCAVLIKGGHLRGLKEAVDVLHSGGDEWLLTLPRVQGRGMRGTGCVYSAAITAGLAKGQSLLNAVERGKEFVTQEIVRSQTR